MLMKSGLLCLTRLERRQFYEVIILNRNDIYQKGDLMKVLTTPERPFRYDELADKIIREARSRLGCAVLRFLDCMILGYGPPVIVFDIYNNHGKLQTFKVILPLGSDKQLKKDHLGLVSCLEAKKLMRIKKI